MQLRYSWPLLCLALGGCGQMETVTVLPDEYEISASPPAGMYGGWIALSPDRDALVKEASARCPSGYKVVNEEVGRGHFTEDYVRWDILCQPLQQGSAQP